jgi:hypothetical protein
MNKQELIDFIQKNYSADEKLVWQIISEQDLGQQTPTSLNKWEKFVEHFNNSMLSDTLSEVVFEAYAEFDEEGKDSD